MKAADTLYDEDEAREIACEAATEVYLKGFGKHWAGITPRGIDVEYVKRFFDECIEEFDGGMVSRFDYPIWTTIRYVLSYSMEFDYSYKNAIDGEKIEDMDLLPAAADRDEIGDMIESYLIAAAALAERINSSTYAGWRELIARMEFVDNAWWQGAFVDENDFDAFFKKHNELLHLLWADNEIMKHNVTLKNPKKASKSKTRKAK